MRLFFLGGSLREGSLNQRLLGLAASRGAAMGATTTLASLRDYPLPLYDPGLDRPESHPPALLALRDVLASHDGLVIASPEYNFSIPGPLKNAIDWLSRLRPQPFTHLPVLLLSASPGLIGGNRGLWALRVPLESLGCLIPGAMFSLAKAADAFDDAGGLRDPALNERLDKSVRDFMTFAAGVRGLERPTA